MAILPDRRGLSMAVRMPELESTLVLDIELHANGKAETLYIIYPPARKSKCNTAILYLTDIFGIQLVNNRL